VDVVARASHWQCVEGAPASARVGQCGVLQRVCVEQLAQEADSLRQVREAAVEGPSTGEAGGPPEPPQEVGRPPRLQRGGDVGLCSVRLPHEFNVLAGLRLEGGDKLCDRLVLLGVPPLLPPDDKVSGLGSKRHQHERGGKKDGPSLHDPASPIGLPVSMRLPAKHGNERDRWVVSQFEFLGRAGSRRPAGLLPAVPTLRPD
jgi:hypothetical protein